MTTIEYIKQESKPINDSAELLLTLTYETDIRGDILHSHYRVMVGRLESGSLFYPAEDRSYLSRSSAMRTYRNLKKEFFCD